MNSTMNCTFPYPFQPNPYPPSNLICTAGSTEFQINTDTGGGSSSVASLSNGGFVVVWFSNNVYGQLYSSTGAIVGSEFQVNSASLYTNSVAAVAGLSNGGFAVVWGGYEGGGIYGQMYINEGTAVGSEFQVNTDTYQDSMPTVTALSNGGFVIVWQASYYNIHGQIYSSTGERVGSEISGGTAFTDTNPAVAGLNNGDFVVLCLEQYGVGIVYGQVFSNKGTVAGSPFGAVGLAVAGLSNGGFIVVGQEAGNIYGQMYNNKGTAVGSGFQVNTDTGVDIDPSVASLSDGGFVVVWNSNNVYGQIYNSTGDVVRSEFQVNADTCQDSMPAVAGLTSGGFVVVWEGCNNGNIYGQIYDSTGEKGAPAPPPSTVSLCNMPEQCYNSASQGTYNLATQIVIPINTDFCQVSSQVCASPLTTHQSQYTAK